MAVDLPRTWRPFGVRFAAFVFGAMLLALALTVWIAWGPDVRSRFTPFQKGTIVFLGLLGFACLHALIRSRVTATAETLTVVNGYRTRRFAWAEVIDCGLRRGAPFAVLDLSDGTSLALFGIQGSDGSRATTAVRELREAVAQQSRTDRND